jgi:hypothetical protein
MGIPLCRGASFASTHARWELQRGAKYYVAPWPSHKKQAQSWALPMTPGTVQCRVHGCHRSPSSPQFIKQHRSINGHSGDKNGLALSHFTSNLADHQIQTPSGPCSSHRAPHSPSGDTRRSHSKQHTTSCRPAAQPSGQYTIGGRCNGAYHPERHPGHGCSCGGRGLHRQPLPRRRDACPAPWQCQMHLHRMMNGGKSMH